MEQALEVEWVDFGREPRCKPDPDWPNGKPVNLMTDPDQKVCRADLPYPAPRCGLYVVKCKICGWSVGITTAGRPDDPPWVALPCRLDGDA
jgi:hypothetical protein